MKDVSPNAPHPQRSKPRQLAGLLAGRLMRPLLIRLLERPKMREFVMHYLSNKLAILEASIERCLPRELHRINGFEDCYWLFSSNRLNHGVTRSTFAEAAFLYKMVQGMQAPRIAELGRFKGGGTILLGAAGAGHVLSLDNGELPGQATFLKELDAALAQLGLQDKVECVMGDAFTWPCAVEAFDLVIVDCATDGEQGARIFTHWWSAVKPGGYMLMSDGKDTPWEDLAAWVASLDIDSHGGTRNSQCPGSYVLFHKLAGMHPK